MNIDPLRKHSVAIYDIAGRLVDQLPVRGTRLNWNPVNVPTGIYFLKFNTLPETPCIKLLKLE